ncbi:hypothetical protein, partial [Burkholderia vietnamiensis]
EINSINPSGVGAMPSWTSFVQQSLGNSGFVQAVPDYRPHNSSVCRGRRAPDKCECVECREVLCIFQSAQFSIFRQFKRT